MAQNTKRRATSLAMVLALAALILSAGLHGHLGHETFAHVHGLAALAFLVSVGTHLRLNWRAVRQNLGL